MRTTASPLSSASWLRSTIVTGMPTLAKFIAMPPPIVPAPSTPHVSMSRIGVSLPMSGILFAARSAKNAYRWAADCGPVTSSTNSFCSTLMPSSNGRLAAASMHWMLYSGARNPRAFLAIDRRKLANSSVSPLAARDLVVAIAHLLQRELLGDGALGERDGCGAEAGDVASVGDLVDQPVGERLGAADVATRRHHLERHRHADEAGEPLRAAGPGQEPEVHLRETELRRRQRHPVVRAQRHLEAAAERRAVDRGDHRDRGILHRRLHLLQAGALHRAAELADVGTGDERAAVADHDDRLGPVADGRLMPSSSPWRTCELSALTGGLSTMTRATSPSVSRRTDSEMVVAEVAVTVPVKQSPPCRPDSGG